MTLPAAVLVDLDGTLADNTHRHFTEYHLCYDDAPIQPVIDLVELLATRYTLVFMSGREDTCRDLTLEWLAKHLPFLTGTPELFMRAAGDYRPDNEVKTELYTEHVAPRFDIRYAVDDRLSVVQAWRSLGITVLDVAGNTF